MPRVISVNISPDKGTQKTPVASAAITSAGISGDAHAGAWHRQVSLLGIEKILSFSAEFGRDFKAGDFAENLTIEGLDLAGVSIRDRIKIGKAELEVTQIGKACHGNGCSVFREVGTCVMPKEGIFARVVSGGEIRPGDALEHDPRPLLFRVVTLSDRASAGLYEDRSGPKIAKRIDEHFRNSRWHTRVEPSLIPDDAERLRSILIEASTQGFDAVFTTGGTGIGPRDISPEVIRPMLSREIPGIMEFIRVKHGASIPQALLSRSLAGLIGSMLVYVLPGSPKAVDEYCDVILPTIEHSILMIAGIDAHG